MLSSKIMAGSGRFMGLSLGRISSTTTTAFTPRLVAVRLLSTPSHQLRQKAQGSRATTTTASSASTSASASTASSSASTTSSGGAEQQHETRQVTVNRELPDPFAFKKQNYYYFTCYGVGVILACVFIFNYEKTSSPVINSVLYFLRRSNFALTALGDDINFADQWPWIWGTLNTVKGDVDIQFNVKGSKGSGVLYLVANRESRQEQFKVRKWVLKLDDEYHSEIDLMTDPSIQLGL